MAGVWRNGADNRNSSPNAYYELIHKRLPEQGEPLEFGRARN
jgi:hypothetical protein